MYNDPVKLFKYPTSNKQLTFLIRNAIIDPGIGLHRIFTVTAGLLSEERHFKAKIYKNLHAISHDTRTAYLLGYFVS